MPFHTMTRAVTLAALLAGSATFATAQAPAPIQPGPPAITMEQARRIASENGVVRIEEIKLDGGKWSVEGRDSAGAEIEIDLRASDGMVIKMERDRPASAGKARP
jgi:uncharacterized membrane protein YkoI